MAYISPTINTNLSYRDFIRFCQNPRKYLIPITSEMYWTHWFRQPDASNKGYIPAAMIEDVEVGFAHSDNLLHSKTMWNFLVQHVNFDRLIFVLVNSNGAIPYEVARAFAALDGEKMLFYYGEMFNFPSLGDIAFANREVLASNSAVIENYFDLVGWMNREYV